MDRRSFLAAGVGVAVSIGKGWAQPVQTGPIDVGAELLARLGKTIETADHSCYESKYQSTRNGTVRGFEQIPANLRVVLQSLRLDVGEPVTSARRHQSEYEQVNCTSSPRDWRETFDLRDRAREETTLSLDRHFATPVPLAARVTIPLTTNFAEQVDLLISQQVSLKKVREVTTDNSRFGEVVVPAHKKAIVRVRKPVEVITRVVRITAVFDGTFRARFKTGSCEVSTGMKFSKFLNEANRTFSVTGTLVDEKAGNLTLVFVDADTSTNDC